ncbi:hypothetical protein OF001_U190038 [Pseudomonas sp. OF001]|nr:hypothetical protein OF001_U190038 [Pseudomonas sp. OF001]
MGQRDLRPRTPGHLCPAGRHRSLSGFGYCSRIRTCNEKAESCHRGRHSTGNHPPVAGHGQAG